METVFDLETHRGKRFSLAEFDPWLVDIEDIAHALSMQCRYNGHCSGFYSVAEHSILVSEWVGQATPTRRTQLLGLMHDAAEAYVGDLIQPVKRLVPAFKAIEKLVQAAIWEAFAIDPPTREECELVKQGDTVLLATEAKYMMSSGGDGWDIQAEVDPEIRFRWLEPEMGRQMFLARFAELAIPSEAPK